MRIAIDAMGGDYAPDNIVDGALEAIKLHNIEIFLVGIEEEIRRVLRRHNTDNLPLKIIHAPDIISMDDSASVALRQKKNSSIRVAADLVRQGEAHGIVSAGHTGVAMATMKIVVGSQEGVERPALATVLPTMKGLAILVDVGANINCKPSQIQQFAIMGRIFAREILGISDPRVGLLSIGEEDTKGTEQTRTAFALLRETPINFHGNLDARNVYDGTVDVIVCDGFVGNIALKISESLADSLERILKKYLTASIISKIGAFLSWKAYKKIKKITDYSEYGGAPLLGLRSIGIICHGRSSPNAIKNAIHMAIEFRKHNVNESIRTEIAKIREISKKRTAGDT